MEVALLDASFVKRKPKGITAMAVCPRAKLLAVARQNGTLEIWHTYTRAPYAARARTTAAHKDVTIRACCWLNEEIVVTPTLGGQLMVWNSVDLNLVDLLPSGGGAVLAAEYCMAKDILGIACEDGRARFFTLSTTQSGKRTVQLEPKYTSALPLSTEALVSISFSSDGNVAYLGDTFGNLRAYDYSAGKVLWTCELTTRLPMAANHRSKRAHMKPTPAIPWTILSLTDTVITGCSTGEVKFIDANTGVVLQSLRTHKADILTMLDTPRGVLVSGVDNQLARLNVSEDDGRWSRSDKRLHQYNDVTCMGLMSERSGVVFTGSLDGTLSTAETYDMFMSADVDTAGMTKRYTTQYFRDRPAFKYMFTCRFEEQGLIDASGSEKGDMMFVVDDFSVTIYGLPDASRAPAGPEHLADVKPQLQFNIQGKSGVRAFAVAKDGRAFAFSTALRTSVMRIVEKDGVLTVLPLTEWDNLPPASDIVFDPTAENMYLATAKGVEVVRSDSSDEPAVHGNSPCTMLRMHPSGSHLFAYFPTPMKGKGGKVVTFTIGEVTKGKRPRDNDHTILKRGVRELTSELVDLAFAEHQGKSTLACLFRHGHLVVYPMMAGKELWTSDSLPTRKGQGCVLSEVHTIVSYGKYFLAVAPDLYTFIDFGKTYTSVFTQSMRDAVDENTHGLKVMNCITEACHIQPAGSRVNLYVLTTAHELAPPCFWRKAYGS